MFLNERSFTSSAIMSSAQMLPHVLSTLTAVQAAKRVRSDIAVVGPTSLAGVLLGQDSVPLGAVLRGDEHRDHWRFLKSLDNSSPWDSYPHLTDRPGEFHEVVFQGEPAVGMLWAKQNDSAILSFAFPPNWASHHVHAHFREMDDRGNIGSAEVTIRNVSGAEHVEAHRAFIEDYGSTVSASSLVYEGDGFVVRMFFNDHNPPHFHVTMSGSPAETLARYRIDTLDVLSGRLAPVVRRRVEVWARDRKSELMRNWERCRSGQHPFFSEE